MLQQLALEDDAVDDQERAVLARIFSSVNRDTVTAEVWAEICRIKERYSIPWRPAADRRQIQERIRPRDR